jgi:glyoxylate reductase
VAEHTVGLILNLTHRINESDRFVRKGEFHGFQFDLFVGDEIKNNTIGIVGLGNIGKDLAKILKNGFGCKICYYDCNRNEQFEKEIGVEFISTLEELMSKADIVSIHVPLCEQTKYLINESNLKLMKKTAYLINTSRGLVVNEKDLVLALQNKTIKGAALDVFENEPIISEELFDMENVILTPHIAASSDESHVNMINMAIDNVINVLDGGKPENICNS